MLIGMSFDRKHWTLTEYIYGPMGAKAPPEACVQVNVRHCWNGENWNRYKVLLNTEANEIEIVTSQEWLSRYNQVHEHEGLEAAETWATDGDVHTNDFDGLHFKAWRMAQDMIKKWEALEALGVQFATNL